tara:strand:+ start:46 stop:483 length:438 start_codon:yes stop_codon:yes gene_type:complete
MKKYIIINKSIISLLIFVVFIFPLSFANSVEPNEILENQYQEKRARNISKNIRCMVCQNQSIDESNSSLAKDLRILIRNKIKEGSTDDDVYKYLTNRYGDFILLKPAFKTSTILLWLLPFVFLLIGIYILFFHNKNSKKQKITKL